MLKEDKSEYYCINCGEKTKSLFKKYSETVLKLTNCDNCNEIADKYLEYDIVIIIIDLILLNTMAYRHILLNTKFKHFWKLSVILILLESYCKWVLTSTNFQDHMIHNKTSQPNLKDFHMKIEDLQYYGICINTTISYSCFTLTIVALICVYKQYFNQKLLIHPSLTLVMKTVTLASTGILLQLPSIIWDLSLYGYHLHFITLYTWLSQLLAFRVICPSPKAWCLFVIFSAHLIKTGVSVNYKF
ncbi:unnamed protein product [Ceutorhynchus assimilis]|uniref:Protein ARV n=1 Tax=Ceutorhynchus assimilis TaxID=467358 RepID=A0A9N9N042_9CUCU|nr:unnamed protein product [Ceutorhynchus assimilis]